jgi:thimet oligopeptidase
MLARRVDEYRRNGIELDAATRNEIARLQEAITRSSLEFERNINTDESEVIAHSDDFAGLPVDFLARHRPSSDGLVRLKLNSSVVQPILQYAKSSTFRRKVQAASLRRAYPANEVVLQRLFAQRAKLADLLGYPDYASFDIARRMARDSGRARRFLDETASAARPVAHGEVSRMLARLQRDDPSLTALGSWDTAYATGLIRKEAFDVDPTQVRSYFRYDKVRRGIFDLVGDLFGVEVRPWRTAVWSKDVEAFEMVEQGEVIGRFFLDMHPRPNKFTGAAMFPVRIGVKGRAVPVATLIASFPDGPLEHRQAETFLHEFGHLLHWVFAGQRPFAAQHAFEVENDVLEAPSDLLEAWAWDHDTLARFATDEKGRPIPAELVARMNAGRQFGRALSTLTSLGLAAVSLDFHSRHPEGKDLHSTFRHAFDHYSLAPFPKDARMFAAFPHLSHYGPAYYTYEWSNALAADLLSKFRAAGLRNRATAQAYREKVLAPGGSASMNTLARSFLGRDWSVDAYRAELRHAK